MITPPKPIVLPQPQPAAQPTPPPPAPQPVTPAPSFVDRMKDFFKSPPETPAPTPDDAPKPAEHKKTPHKINVDLSDVTRTTVEKSEPHRTSSDAQKQLREEQKRLAAYNNAVRNLEKNFTPSTKVEMPGSSSVSYASYASIIKSIYTREWTPPDNAANDEANIKVSITVSSDGTVVSAHIVDPSGDSSVDESVQRTLDRVTFIAPFPEGATEKEKTFIINFNLKAKRMLG
jgi:TonB family protein